MFILWAWCLSICILSPIPDYTNVRKLCPYNNMFKYVGIAMYNLYYCPLMWYVEQRINSYNAAYGFIHLESLVTPECISMGIKRRAEFFLISWVIRLHWYSKFVECIAIVIKKCPSQYRRSAWNPLFSTMGPIYITYRRFNLEPTTPNSIYLGTLN